MYCRRPSFFAVNDRKCILCNERINEGCEDLRKYGSSKESEAQPNPLSNLEKEEIIKDVCHLLQVKWTTIQTELGDDYSLCPTCVQLMTDLVQLKQKLILIESEMRAKILEIENVVINIEEQQNFSNGGIFRTKLHNLLQQHILDGCQNKRLLRDKVLEFNSSRTAGNDGPTIEVEPSFVQLHLDVRSVLENTNLNACQGEANQGSYRTRRLGKLKQAARKNVTMRETRQSFLSIKDEPEDSMEFTASGGDDELNADESFLQKEEGSEDKDFLPEDDDSVDGEDDSGDSDFGIPKSRAYLRRTRSSVRDTSVKISKSKSFKVSPKNAKPPNKNRRKYSMDKWKVDTKEDGRMFFKGIEITRKLDESGGDAHLLICGVCGKQYVEHGDNFKPPRSRWQILKEHIAARHLGANRCEICKKNFSKPKALRHHMNSKHGPHKLINPMGYDKWPDEIVKGEGEKMFYRSVEIVKTDLEIGYDLNCSLCEKTINSERARQKKRCPYRLIIIHIKIHHQDEYKCHLCNKTYTDPRTLQHHISFKHSANPPMLACDICGKPLQTYEVIKNHKWSHKNEEEREAAIASGDRPPVGYREIVKRRKQKDSGVSYQCTQCGKTYDGMTSLKRHEETHNDRTHQCSHCGKFYVSTERLRNHVKFVHERERVNKKYYCKFCPKNFITRGAWMKHERQHTGEIPYHCPICSKGYALKQTMTRHAKTCTATPQDHRVQTQKRAEKRKKGGPEIMDVARGNEEVGTTSSVSLPSPISLVLPPQLPSFPKSTDVFQGRVAQMNPFPSNSYNPYFARHYGHGETNRQPYM